MSRANKPTPEPATEKTTRGNRAAARWLLLAGVIAAAGMLYHWWGSSLSLAGLAAQEQHWRELQLQQPVTVLLAAFAIYAMAVGLSFPGAAGLTLAYGWFFGIWKALLIVSFASTTGALFAFLLSRYLLRDWVARRFQQTLAKTDKALETDGPFYLFMLRLTPLVPFFVVNLVMGLTQIRARTFWWVSQLGMLPGTLLYVYAGSRVPRLQDLAEGGLSSALGGWKLAQLGLALTLLGAFPLAAKKLWARYAHGRGSRGGGGGR